METTLLGLRVLLALACVVGLIWVLARRAGWGKGRRRPAGPAVEVVGRQALGRHAGVAVIAVGNRRLLLGYGEQNVTMLTELAPAPAEMPSSVADATPAGPPMTLGALAAAVLPTPRGPRTPRAARATRRAVPAGDAFADVLADAERTAPAVPVSPVAAAATATAAASASAAAALAAAAVIPVDPARTPAVTRVEHVAEPVGSGALHGSVLAPSTWKQAVAVLRERTVRR